MQVTVSRVSPVEIALRIALPKERVSTALDRAYNEIGKTAQIRGFRKGKVPRPLLKQFYGPQVTNQVARKLIDETLPGAMRDKALEPITEPRLEAADELTGAQDWSYTAVLEVRPEVAKLDVSALQVTRNLYSVSEEDVDRVIAKKREENSTLHTPEPMRPVQAGDQVTVDYHLLLDGVERPEFSATGRTVEAGNNTLLKELDAALVGMSPGESKEVTVNFPESHRQKDIAGREGTIRLVVSAVQEKVLPELDDEFAKDVGKDSLAELRASVRADLERELKERSDEELRNSAVLELIKAHPIPLPPSLVRSTADQIRDEILRSAGLQRDASSAGLLGEIESMLVNDAETRVRAGLLLAELARQNNLFVTEEDLTARLEELSKETGKAVPRLRAEYRDPQKKQFLISQVIEIKVLDLLVSKAQITDKVADANAETPAPDAPAAETSAAT